MDVPIPQPGWPAACLCLVLFGAALPAGAQEAPLPQIITPEFQHNAAIVRPDTSGHFFLDAAVNGTPVRMMFDTGASAISLRAEDAARLGVDLSGLHYSARAKTANGTAEVAPVTIATVTVGRITRHHVAALVSRPGALSENLLGQSFLSSLAGYRVEGDQLILVGD